MHQPPHRRRQKAEKARTEAAELVQRVGVLTADSDSIGDQIAAAARLLDWAPSRTENIWHGEAHRIDSWEMDDLRMVIRNHRRRRRPKRKK